MRGRLWGMIAGASFLAFSAGAHAYLTSGTSGSLSASADFSVAGPDLIVTLTNTSGSDVLNPSQVLTGVFFDVAGVGGLTPVSGFLSGGSTVFFGSGGSPGAGNVGGEWAYASSLSGAPGGASEGISSSGLGLFGPGDNFPGDNLQGPVEVDGLQYGITSAGDDTTTGNAAVTGGNALIQNAVVLDLSGLPVGFVASIDTIQNVSFQYGTALTDTSFPCDLVEGCGPKKIPEPSTLALLGVVGIALGFLRLHKSA